ncbi:unnamed protein product (macronuclear) [Paramecium tetraurelia]|uniref:Uncharacterized protein n=1 Tax=Paramecium tetraurelia TaxID=5888 RepID=A0BED4_PARTE|nr:uncharacterized protein GSPATT00027934001 [Paramecium tetraurelia]CAK56901.1 unnamed protein product [Paramecium tetraurelia]|eukprot:XP_001424299.1 hypothetical protein (macronuclear) [Paramecium tetraurelia strain d4-2]
MLQSLNKLKLQLRAEIEILKMCLDKGKSTTMVQMIDKNKQRLEQDGKQLELIIKRLEEGNQLTLNEKDKLDTLKLNISKVLIQNEKIYNSDEQFKDLISKVPRIKDDQSQNQSFQQSKKEESSIQIKSAIKTIQQTTQEQQQPQEVYQQYQIVRNNVDNLISEISNLNLRVDNHKHTDLQQQIDKLKLENAKMQANFKLLKQDNTELFFINNDIKKLIQQIEMDNEEIIKSMNILREQSKPMSNPQSRLSNYYIPYDETKAQEADEIMNRLKQN